MYAKSHIMVLHVANQNSFLKARKERQKRKGVESFFPSEGKSLAF